MKTFTQEVNQKSALKMSKIKQTTRLWKGNKHIGSKMCSQDSQEADLAEVEA